MIHLRSFIMLLVGGLGLGLAGGATPADSGGDERVPRLIRQLGSDQFREREAATDALDGLGAAALEPLRKATKSEDAEVRRRAADLVQRIEKRVETARILAPLRVRLVYQDTPVADAVADFARKSGYP